MCFEEMRVGLVGPLAPPPGGMASQTVQLSELLAGEGARVELVQTNRAYRPKWTGRIPVLRALVRLVPYLLDLWRLTGRVDVVHVMANSGWSWHLFCSPALWISRFRSTPVVINFRGGDAENFLSHSASLVRVSLRLAAALIVPSSYLHDVFTRFGFRAEVVPNVIDLARFRPQRAGRDPDAVRLLVARNLEAIYDNAGAIRALKHIQRSFPDATLTLTGTGPEHSRLQDLSRELGLEAHVHLTGPLDREAMALLYQRVSVMLNPSLTDNMPNSVLEALACGIPIVSTNVGGIPHLLRHGETALLVRPGRPDEFADAVLELLASPALRARLVDNGLREVERYTWSSVSPLLLQVYRRAIRRDDGAVT